MRYGLLPNDSYASRLFSRSTEKHQWTKANVTVSQLLVASRVADQKKANHQSRSASYNEAKSSRKRKRDVCFSDEPDPTAPVSTVEKRPKVSRECPAVNHSSVYTRQQLKYLDSDDEEVTFLPSNHPTTSQDCVEKKPILKKPVKPRVKDSFSIIERKLVFIRDFHSRFSHEWTHHIDEVERNLCLWRTEDQCWLHESPPQPSRSRGRSRGTINSHFGWKDTLNAYHSINVNYGIVALMANNRLTQKQQDGFIYHSWHLSHLCGNWTCCNWKHFTVEPGSANISRNACLLSDGRRTRKSNGRCKHEPQCMREKKIKNLATSPTPQAGT